jgi:hypothetical protein
LAIPRIGLGGAKNAGTGFKKDVRPAERKDSAAFVMKPIGNLAKKNSFYSNKIKNRFIFWKKSKSELGSFGKKSKAH